MRGEAIRNHYFTCPEPDKFRGRNRGVVIVSVFLVSAGVCLSVFISGSAGQAGGDSVSL